MATADYHKARALTAEATTLSQQILDARLALSRLRSAHPPPRLTIPGALAALDAQVAQMQEADERVQDVGARVGKVKERVGERAREVERLRVRRTEVEKEVRERGGAVEVDDGVAGALYDWWVLTFVVNCSTCTDSRGQVHGLPRPAPLIVLARLLPHPLRKLARPHLPRSALSRSGARADARVRAKYAHARERRSRGGGRGRGGRRGGRRRACTYERPAGACRCGAGAREGGGVKVSSIKLIRSYVNLLYCIPLYSGLFCRVLCCRSCILCLTDSYYSAWSAKALIRVRCSVLCSTRVIYGVHMHVELRVSTNLSLRA